MTPKTAAHQASLSINNSQSLLKLMSIEPAMPSNHLILCHRLLLLLLTSIFPASGSFLRSQFFALGGETIGASASPSVLPMNTHYSFPLGLTGLISLPSKGLSAPQFKASILRCSDFFMVQLLHPNMTTGKNIALTRQTFVGKVMSLLFNMLSMLIIAFLPRSKHLLFHGCSHHLQ